MRQGFLTPVGLSDFLAGLIVVFARFIEDCYIT